MIQFTKINEDIILINPDLIEFVEFIPESKINMNNGKYHVVSETKEEIMEKVVEYRKKIANIAIREES